MVLVNMGNQQVSDVIPVNTATSEGLMRSGRWINPEAEMANINEEAARIPYMAMSGSDHQYAKCAEHRSPRDLAKIGIDLIGDIG